MSELAQRVRQFLDCGAGTLPFPGQGQTPQRHRALCEVGELDLSVARIVEAHTDALAICAEAGYRPDEGSLYGVWASDGPQSQLVAERTKEGWRLTGIKQYCSGAHFVSDALVTAHHEGAVLMFRVALNLPGVAVEPSTWASPAMADTATAPVSFGAVSVSESACLKGGNWYLERPGFWHGAIGPAACWAGGALSLVNAARKLNRRDAHARAHLGAMEAAAWNLTAVLDRAGTEIDQDPKDAGHQARRRALMVRHLIERTATEVLDRFGRATGPQLLAFNHEVARQHGALTIYMRQCHAERDLEAIPP